MKQITIIIILAFVWTFFIFYFTPIKWWLSEDGDYMAFTRSIIAFLPWFYLIYVWGKSEGNKQK